MSNCKHAFAEFISQSKLGWHALTMNWRYSGRAGIFAITVAACASCLFSGCTSVSSSIGSIFSGGCMSDAIELHRNRTCALKAWFRREHNFCDQPYLRDFKDGFVDGYVAIAEGKPGCPPSVPPKKYWGWAYQTPEGQAQMAAWYAGYPYGVQAAKDDGLGNRGFINLGPNFTVNQPMQNWSGNYGQPYPSYDNTNVSPTESPSGESDQPASPSSESSILQDSSARNSGSPNTERFSDSNFTLIE